MTFLEVKFNPWTIMHSTSGVLRQRHVPTDTNASPPAPAAAPLPQPQPQRQHSNATEYRATPLPNDEGICQRITRLFSPLRAWLNPQDEEIQLPIDNVDGNEVPQSNSVPEIVYAPPLRLPDASVVDEDPMTASVIKGLDKLRSFLPSGAPIHKVFSLLIKFLHSQLPLEEDDNVEPSGGRRSEKEWRTPSIKHLSVDLKNYQNRLSTMIETFLEEIRPPRRDANYIREQTVFKGIGETFSTCYITSDELKKIRNADTAEVLNLFNGLTDLGNFESGTVHDAYIEPYLRELNQIRSDDQKREYKLLRPRNIVYKLKYCDFADWTLLNAYYIAYNESELRNSDLFSFTFNLNPFVCVVKETVIDKETITLARYVASLDDFKSTTESGPARINRAQVVLWFQDSIQNEQTLKYVSSLFAEALDWNSEKPVGELKILIAKCVYFYAHCHPHKKGDSAICRILQRILYSYHGINDTTYDQRANLLYEAVCSKDFEEFFKSNF